MIDGSNANEILLSCRMAAISSPVISWVKIVSKTPGNFQTSDEMHKQRTRVFLAKKLEEKKLADELNRVAEQKARKETARLEKDREVYYREFKAASEKFQKLRDEEEKGHLEFISVIKEARAKAFALKGESPREELVSTQFPVTSRCKLEGAEKYAELIKRFRQAVADGIFDLILMRKTGCGCLNCCPRSLTNKQYNAVVTEYDEDGHIQSNVQPGCLPFDVYLPLWR